MSDPRNDWKRELQPAADCIAIERLGEELTADEREHLAGCPRCQAEMALFNEFENSETIAAEKDDVNAIVEELGATPASARRLHTDKVVAFRPRRRYLAIAAMLLIAVAIGYVLENREPSIEGPITKNLYRSLRVEVIAPVGNVAAAPRELQWKPVSGADSYEVVVSEVDGTELWRATTHEPHVALPEEIVRRIVPGKTLVWQVTALRDRSAIQSSGTNRFRVTTQRRP